MSYWTINGIKWTGAIATVGYGPDYGEDLIKLSGQTNSMFLVF